MKVVKLLVSEGGFQELKLVFIFGSFECDRWGSMRVQRGFKAAI